MTEQVDKGMIEAGGARMCVVADLTPSGSGINELLFGLDVLDMLLSDLWRRAKDAAAPGGNGWRPPAALGVVRSSDPAGDEAAGGLLPPAVAAVRRVHDRLLPTQTQIEQWPREPRIIRCAGPEWYAAGGRLPLSALSWVWLPTGDLQLLGTVAAELGRTDGDPYVREAVRWGDETLGIVLYSDLARERCRVAATAARIHGLLDLEATPDTAALYEARQAAGEDSTRLVLTPEQEAAYVRTLGRINAMVNLGDPVTWQVMGGGLGHY